MGAERGVDGLHIEGVHTGRDPIVSLIGRDRAGRAERSNRRIVGSVTGRIRGAEESEAGFAECRGKMEGAAVQAKDCIRATGGVDEPGEVALVPQKFRGSGLVGGDVENQVEAVICLEQGRQLQIAFDGPLLRSPTREGGGENERRLGQGTVGVALGQFRRESLKAKQFRVPINDVGGGHGSQVRVEDPGGFFAEILREAEAGGSSTQQGDEAALDQALEINGAVGLPAAEPTERGPNRKRVAAVEGNEMIGGDGILEQGEPLGFEDPSDFGSGFRGAQGAHGGERV